MGYGFAADLVAVLHFVFILFVVFGGLLVIRRPKAAWAHIPTAVWGVLIEFTGLICPLTPLENRLRRAGGEAGYGGGFIEHYLIPLIYPAGLTRELQVLLGVAVLLINVSFYGFILVRWRRKRREAQ